MTPAGEALAALGRELDERAATTGLERVAVGEAVEYRVGGRAVVVAGPDAVEFRLGPQVARAATGTPDAAPSTRGPEWVAFGPRELDRFALDRATSWFDLAVRLASAKAAG